MNKIDFKGKLILGPMAGVTDLPFRRLCRECGADITVTEMVSAKGLQFDNQKTRLLTATCIDEKPVGLQLFGHEPDVMAAEAEKYQKAGFDFIDVNMGCPVPKIVNNHEGSALMKNPELAAKIITEMVSAVSIPITVKIRAGFDSENKNAPEFARILENAGAAAVTVHGRTREQYYLGKADWNIIKRVKESVAIPVIGNGDICSADDLIRMKEETGCDGFMIARAAKGNPWIFSEIKTMLNGGEYKKPGKKEILDMMFRQIDMMEEHKGEYIAVREMRKHIAWYTEGIKGSSEIRRKTSEITDIQELKNYLSASLCG